MSNRLFVIAKFFAISFLIWGCSTAHKSTKTNKILVNPERQETTSSLDQVSPPTVILPLSDTSLNVASVIDIPITISPIEKAAIQHSKGVRKDLDWAPAIHFDNRKPSYIVIHHTAQNSLAQTVRTFSLEHTKVSAHYVVGRDGQVVQMLNDYYRGWHAGKSKWGNITDLNSVSLGIELDNNGKEPFPEYQINALLNLLDTLKNRYEIPQTNFIGHSDIAPARKDDPSVFFPWKTLAENGFGIWYNEKYLETPPDNFNPVDALKIIGYDVSKLKATIVAFKRKFIKTDLTPELTAFDRSVLYDLYKKY